MKNFPFIPVIMITAMAMIIIHGHRVSRETAPKAEYSMAAGIDAHLTTARKAFISHDRFIFKKELISATELLTKEAYCEDCLDKEIAEQSLPSLVDIRHQYESETLELEHMDKVFGEIITSLAKNHIVYTYPVFDHIYM